MKRLLLYLLSLVFISVHSNCRWIYETYENNVSGVTLTDEIVVKYIKATKALHNLGPSIPQKLAEKGEGQATGMELYNEIPLLKRLDLRTTLNL